MELTETPVLTGLCIAALWCGLCPGASAAEKDSASIIIQSCRGQILGRSENREKIALWGADAVEIFDTKSHVIEKRIPLGTGELRWERISIRREDYEVNASRSASATTIHFATRLGMREGRMDEVSEWTSGDLISTVFLSASESDHGTLVVGRNGIETARGKISFPEYSAKGMAIDRSGKIVALACSYQSEAPIGKVITVDAATGRRLGELDVRGWPRGIVSGCLPGQFFLDIGIAKYDPTVDGTYEVNTVGQPSCSRVPAGAWYPALHDNFAISEDERFFAAFDPAQGRVSVWDFGNISLVWSKTFPEFNGVQAAGVRWMALTDDGLLLVRGDGSDADEPIVKIDKYGNPGVSHLDLLTGAKREVTDMNVEWLKKADVRLRAETRHPVKPEPLGKRLRLAVEGDIYDMTTGIRLTTASGRKLRLLSTNADVPEWLVIDERDGVYDASQFGARLVSLTDKKSGNAKHALEFPALNRPDLLIERIWGGETEASKMFKLRAEQRKPKPGRGEFGLSVMGMDVEEGRLRLLISGSEAGVPGGGFCQLDGVWNNGVKVSSRCDFYDPATGKEPEENGYWAAKLVIPVGVGANRVSLRMKTSKGLVSEELVVNVRGSPPKHGRRLFFVGCGVSEYLDPELGDLGFATKDVVDLEKAFRGLGGGLEMRSKLLLDGEVTVEGLKSVQSFLNEASTGDLVVVFLAGHGMYDPDKTGYYFMPGAARHNNVAETAIPLETFKEIIDSSPAVRRLFLVDTCESGAAQPELLAKLEENLGRDVRLRGTRRPEFTPAAASGLKGRYLLNRDRAIYQDDSDGRGVVVFSACLGDESSYESDELQNGFFTEALIEALAGKADLDQNGLISKRELFEFVTTRVGELSDVPGEGAAQHPAMERNNPWIDFDFPVPSYRTPGVLDPKLLAELDRDGISQGGMVGIMIGKFNGYDAILTMNWHRYPEALDGLIFLPKSGRSLRITGQEVFKGQIGIELRETLADGQVVRQAGWMAPPGDFVGRYITGWEGEAEGNSFAFQDAPLKSERPFDSSYLGEMNGDPIRLELNWFGNGNVFGKCQRGAGEPPLELIGNNILDGVLCLQAWSGPSRTEYRLEGHILLSLSKNDREPIWAGAMYRPNGLKGQKIEFRMVKTTSEELPGHDGGGVQGSVSADDSVKGFPGERFPATRERLLQAQDLGGMTLGDVQYAINELFARHGAWFPKDEVRAEFTRLSWYRPNKDLDFEGIEAGFSEVEKANLLLLAERRRILRE